MENGTRIGLECVSGHKLQNRAFCRLCRIVSHRESIQGNDLCLSLAMQVLCATRET